MYHRQGCLSAEGRYWQSGKPCEVRLRLWNRPLLLICGAMSFPKNVSEYDVAGGVAGWGIKVITGELPTF